MFATTKIGATIGPKIGAKIGVAAGIDKNGTKLDRFPTFGFVEVGSVTLEPQTGNELPVIWCDQKTVFNRMGCPSVGAKQVIDNIKIHLGEKNKIIGVNVVKMRETPNHLACQEYEELFSKVVGVSDYVTLNLSSPSVNNIEELQEPILLQTILSRVKRRQMAFFHKSGRYVPIFIKVSFGCKVKEVAEVLIKEKIDGVIAMNSIPDEMEGYRVGRSGSSIFADMLKMVSEFRRHLPSDIVVIACGGIMSQRDAQKALEVRADAVQVCSAILLGSSTL
jgi:dihydroorotate dehydrogenase